MQVLFEGLLSPVTPLEDSTNVVFSSGCDLSFLRTFQKEVFALTGTVAALSDGFVPYRCSLYGFPLS